RIAVFDLISVAIVSIRKLKEKRRSVFTKRRSFEIVSDLLSRPTHQDHRTKPDQRRQFATSSKSSSSFRANSSRAFLQKVRISVKLHILGHVDDHSCESCR